MYTKRFSRAGRLFVATGVVILPMLLAGCGESGSDTSPKSDADVKVKQDEEKAAREAAYGKGGQQKPASAPGSGANKRSSKG